MYFHAIEPSFREDRRSCNPTVAVGPHTPLLDHSTVGVAQQWEWEQQLREPWRCCCQPDRQRWRQDRRPPGRNAPTSLRTRPTARCNMVTNHPGRRRGEPGLEQGGRQASTSDRHDPAARSRSHVPLHPMLTSALLGQRSESLQIDFSRWRYREKRSITWSLRH